MSRYLIRVYREAMNRAIDNGRKDLARIQRIASRLVKKLEAELKKREAEPQILDNHKPKRKSTKPSGWWKVTGYDTFSSESYDLSKHRTKEAAMNAAKKRLAELEKSQPTSSSGGQGFGGIQDRVYVENPAGENVRIQ